MDFENALMEDFESDSDNSNEIAESVSDDVAAPQQDEKTRPKSLNELLESKTTNISHKLHQLDAMTALKITELSTVIPLIPLIREELAKYESSMDTEYMDLIADLRHQSDSEEYSFLVQLSNLPVLINQEISLVQRYISTRYKVVFPELETLVANPVDYCRIVLEVGQDLIGIRAHETRLKQIVSPEKVLTIVMAALQQFASAFDLSNGDMENIFEACNACLELHQFLTEISRFISGKLAKYAPNVCAIIGPVATSQLLVSVGSLSLLASTPSCNIASFGVRDLSSNQKTRPPGFIRATGYLYQCPLVVGLPPEVVKQALRIISGKVVLAARIDLSKSALDGSLGANYLKEIQNKIDKLLAPPELAATKALPVPKEQKSKKRGGRRFRKMKERFQMSELRKAQNKMQFGQQEQSVVDTFGEEVGLGMSKQLDGISVNRNTDARMSKAMVSRLQEQQKKERESLDTILLAPVVTKREREPEGVWGTMKRQRVEEDEI